MEKRHVKRLQKIEKDMLKHQKATVSQFCHTKSSEKGAYSLFSHQDVSIQEVQEHIYNQCEQNCEPKHYLCIQDTTSFNFNHIAGKLKVSDKHIGTTENKRITGVLSHPTLVIEAQDHMPIGLSYAKIWARPFGSEDKRTRKYNTLPIEQKESYRWIEAAVQSKEVLSKATMLTVIGDRESDIYEEFVRVPDQKTNLLVRSRVNRKLSECEQKLYQHLEQQEQALTYKLAVPRNRTDTKRVAKMTLKYGKVKLACPANLVKKGTLPACTEVWAIQAKEISESVPNKVTPVNWYLLTTHELSCPADALQCIEWYTLRWQIEQLFRVIKKKGLDVESSQLSTGMALQKQVLVALSTGVKILQLTLGRDAPANIKASLIFSEEQILCLEVFCKNKLEGKMQKQKNPYHKGSLAWAAWCIARLGNWIGYLAGKPGPITFTRGLKKFESVFRGWEMALELQKKSLSNK